MANAIPVQAGSFVIHNAGELHFDGAKDEPCELLIVGMGPAASMQPDGKQ